MLPGGWDSGWDSKSYHLRPQIVGRAAVARPVYVSNSSTATSVDAPFRNLSGFLLAVGIFYPLRDVAIVVIGVVNLLKALQRFP
jgi:hypothetical protein